MDRNTSTQPPHPRPENAVPTSWMKRKRSKTSESDDEYMARSLISQSRRGGDASPSAAFEKTKKVPAGRLYKCSKCGSSFLTGQALGGHMRMHYRGVIVRNKVPKHGVNSFDGGSGNGSNVVPSSSDRGSVTLCTNNNGSDAATLRPLNLETDCQASSEIELDLTLKL